MTIDTLAYAKRLEDAGIDRKHAEAHAEAMAQLIFPDLATKTDLDKAVFTLKTDLDKAVFTLKTDLDKAVSDMTKTVSELTVRLLVTMIGVAGLALAIARVLH